MLFTAGSPRASRASFTGCSCSTICASLSSRAPSRGKFTSRPATSSGLLAFKAMISESRAHQRRGSQAVKFMFEK
jgi:hypothetical protein